MILSAQRVLPRGVPVGTATVVNAYRYRQESEFDGMDALERLEAGGILMWRADAGAPPPGNRVVSFLDVSLPSDVSSTEVAEATKAFLDSELMLGAPATFRAPGTRIAFRYALSRELADPAARRSELAALLRATLT